MKQFDHFVLAAADLEAAKAEFAAQSGCEPADGGAHTGLGTRNALASFGGGSYLEIIAPDPEQSHENNMAARLKKLDATTPLHWAIRVDDLPGLAERARALGFNPGPILDTARQQPDGTLLEWRLLGLRGGHEFGGLVPFFIDWLDCPHPADNNPIAGHVSLFEISLPAGPAHELLAGTAGLTLREGAPGMTLRVETPAGMIAYTATDPAGFTL